MATDRFFEFMPDALAQRLHGVTLNQALLKGIIDDLGDHEGNFIHEDLDRLGYYYAIIQGYTVKCSERLMEDYTPEQIIDIAGLLSLFRYKVGTSYEFQLGRPNGIRLGKPKINIKALAVDPLTEFEVDAVTLIPRTTPPPNFHSGTMYFDKEILKLKYFDGHNWNEVAYEGRE